VNKIINNINILFVKKIISSIALNQAIAQSDFVDCQSNPNPSQICDWKSKSNFQNGLTIQSKSNHNPTIIGKKI